jgi:hypothetical protein
LPAAPWASSAAVAEAAGGDGDRRARAAGLVGDDVDDAAAGAVAVEHGAGAADDLDALDALERHRRPADGAHVDGVEALAVDEDQGIAGGGVAEAAQVDGGIDAQAAVEGAHVDPGMIAQDGGQVEGRRVADVLARDDGNVGRHARIGVGKTGGADDDRRLVGCGMAGWMEQGGDGKRRGSMPEVHVEGSLKSGLRPRCRTVSIKRNA